MKAVQTRKEAYIGTCMELHEFGIIFDQVILSCEHIRPIGSLLSELTIMAMLLLRYHLITTAILLIQMIPCPEKT